MTAERCPRCDRPPVTDEHYNDTAHYPPGADTCSCALCRSFCWADWNEADCEAHAVDWRARALAAESSLAARDALIPGPRDGRAVGDRRGGGGDGGG